MPSECSINPKRIPRFRWRIVPAVILLILGSQTVAISIWAAIEPQTHVAWIHRLPMCSGGLVWILASVFWHRAKWWLAIAFTLLGFVLPYLNPVFWF